MSTEISDLEFFTVLAAAGTMSEAARHWGISVSGVSRRLSALEKRLGASLAHRGGRSLTLTSEGQAYRARGAEILQDLRDLENAINPHPRDLTGSIRVICTMGLGRIHVAPIIRSFRRLHPSIDIMLELTSLPLSSAVPDFDLAIQVGPVPDSSMAIRQLLANRRVVVASPKYLALHETPKSIEQLKRHTLLVVRENDGESAWRFLRNGNEFVLPVHSGLSCNDGLAVTEWALDGEGLAMRSTWQVAPLIAKGELVQILPAVDTPPANVIALFRGSGHAPPRVRRLVDFIGEQLGSRCSSERTDSTISATG